MGRALFFRRLPGDGRIGACTPQNTQAALADCAGLSCPRWWCGWLGACGQAWYPAGIDHTV